MTQERMDFEHFQRDNRCKVNHSLNKVLWFCILAGPAIALGVIGGVFKNTSLLSCGILSVAMAAVAGGNYLILKRNPYSYAPGILALVAVDLLLGYMNASHISIRLTWVLVPILSLLLCERRVYIGISILNYLVMGVATWLESGYYAGIRADFTSPLAGFINVFAGCTIEAVIMFAAGYALGEATRNYYRKMIDQYAETQTQQDRLEQQLNILDSMAEIYEHVNLIDFGASTEMSLREEKLTRIPIAEGQDHTNMTQKLRGKVAPDMVEDFWSFTDITTVQSRLVNHKLIVGEFISVESGWFRAQYIRVEGDLHQKPDVVIFTIQSIDSDKRREEHLIRISQTDELTRLYNRRRYEEDVQTIVLTGIADDLALISADVNGLKPVNDNLGHAAGDELITGAATCLLAAAGGCGKVYRTGGDEFMAIVRTDDCAALLKEISRGAAEWRGKFVDHVSLSLGYASHAEHPEASIAELEKLADMAMYEDKAEYYRKSGKDRRQG